MGRERIYFDRIWNDFTGDPSKPDEATRDFFAATYAQPGGMRAGFAQFSAFSQDATDNKIFEQTKLAMPVLAVGGEKSFGPLQAVIMRNVATNVREAVVAGSGHCLMEERPVETVALIRGFLDASPEERLTPAEYEYPARGNPGTGSIWSCRHPNGGPERRSESGWGIHHYASRARAYPDRSPFPSRRSRRNCDFRNVAHRIRRSLRRVETQGASSGKLLHRTTRPDSFCRNRGRTRCCSDYRLRPIFD